MYFATTPLDVQASLNQLQSLLGQLLPTGDAGKPNYFYALIDCAFNEKITDRFTQLAPPIYANTALAQLAEISPRLLVLEEEEAARLAQLQKVLKACAAMPMLSFLVSPLEVDALSQVLAGLVMVQTEDRLEWPLRFADTRILPKLLETLTPAQKQTYLGGIAYWIWPDRAAQWQMAKLGLPVQGHSLQLQLSDAQFATMLANSEADNVLAELHTASPEVVDRRVGHENHALVSRALAVLHTKQFEQLETQVKWATLALVFAPDLLAIPEIAGALASAASEEALRQHLDTLPDQVWASVETAAVD